MVVVHCKGGKGRTGMVVACLLMRLGIQCTPEMALDYFAQKRTSKMDERVKKQRVSSRKGACYGE